MKYILFLIIGLHLNIKKLFLKITIAILQRVYVRFDDRMLRNAQSKRALCDLILWNL